MIGVRVVNFRRKRRKSRQPFSQISQHSPQALNPFLEMEKKPFLGSFVKKKSSLWQQNRSKSAFMLGVWWYSGGIIHCELLRVELIVNTDVFSRQILTLMINVHRFPQVIPSSE